jgi:hypothetical protein
LSLRTNNPNDRGDALQTPRRERWMSRQIYNDANCAIRSQDPRDLRRIKSPEDSGSADVDYGPGKFHPLRRGRADAAAQPQTKSAFTSPFFGSISWYKDFLGSAPIGICFRHDRPLLPVRAVHRPPHEMVQSGTAAIRRLKPLSQPEVSGSSVDSRCKVCT